MTRVITGPLPLHEFWRGRLDNVPYKAVEDPVTPRSTTGFLGISGLMDSAVLAPGFGTCNYGSWRSPNSKTPQQELAKPASQCHDVTVRGKLTGTRLKGRESSLNLSEIAKQ